MTFGYNPEISSWSPFHGAVYAVLESVSKYVALGGDYKKAWLTLQEYFERLRDEGKRWGKPFSALLGAYLVQEKLGIAAIGGKDSMSGSYNDLDVPPTLVSFCVGTVDTEKVISAEFKERNSKVAILKTRVDENFLPDFEDLKENYEIIHKLIKQDKVRAVMTVRNGGIAETITKMAMGNKIGFKFEKDIDVFVPMYNTFIIELKEDIENAKLENLGITQADKNIEIKGIKLDLEELIKEWKEPLEKVFQTKTKEIKEPIENILSDKKCVIIAKENFAKPRIFIPSFPRNKLRRRCKKSICRCRWRCTCRSI